MLKLTNITKRYYMGDEEVRALDSVTLTVEQGDFISIVGPSGSGKSTLMNIVGCLDIADEGTYSIDNQLVHEYSQKELAKLRNEKIGFIFQNFNLLPQLTAAENVELPLIYQKMHSAQRKARVLEVLDQVGLSERAKHKPAELSGGQQQRVAIARALITAPSIFLADEPTGALDSKTGDEVIGLFRELHAQGNTLIVITHDEHIADQADRKIRIMDGRINEVTA